MFKLNENTNSKMLDYAESIYDYLVVNDLEFDEYDYDDFAEELDVAILNGEVINIPELDREDAFKLAISIKNEREDYYDGDESMDGDWDSSMKSAGWGTDEDYGNISDVFESKDKDMSDYDGENIDLNGNLIKETNQLIDMLNESLASRKAKKLGLVHVGFGNYSEEPGGQAKYKTIDGKLKKVKSFIPKRKKAEEPKKEKPKEKEEPKTDIKPKKHGITDVRRVSGEKFTYEFLYNGRKYKFTLNKLERKELKDESSVMNIIKQRMKKKELRQRSKQFKKGKHLEKNNGK